MQWHVHITASRFFSFDAARLFLFPWSKCMWASVFLLHHWSLGKRCLVWNLPTLQRPKPRPGFTLHAAVTAGTYPKNIEIISYHTTALSAFTYIQNCPFSSNTRHFVEGYWPKSVSFSLVWNSGLFHPKWTRRKARSFNSKPTGTHLKLKAKKLPRRGLGFL